MTNKCDTRVVGISFLMLALTLASCVAAPKRIDTFIMDYPHGEDRILVKRSGEAYLYYGALPSAQMISKDTFSVDDLYRSFEGMLYPNAPREQWPNRDSQCGMVTIRYSDGSEEDYLIFDADEVTEKLFEQARRNIAGTLFNP